MSLEELYDSEAFRKHGHEMIDLLADHLLVIKDYDAKKVINYIEPDENYHLWDKAELKTPQEIFKAFLDNSIHLHHPKYMGHQVTVPAPMAALAGMEGMLLNSGGAIYEMSAASSTLEKWVIDQLKGYFGFDQGDGIITSGGTLANLTALICARNVKAPENVWVEGQKERYAFMVSEEAHYCIDRAVRVMGWGEAGMIKIPVDQHYKMRTELLEEYYLKASQDGIKVLGVVGSAPTTSTGIYDDLVATGEFCKTNDLWFHIDAAHGGPAVFSDKYKYLMQGAEMADSITVDAHKMMMVPSLTTFLFFRESKNSYKTFAQKAQYLWSASDEEWYNYGKRTMECTKIMLSTRIYILLKLYGIQIFESYLDQCYNTARIFAEMISKHPDFDLAVAPDSNIVCFRFKGNSKMEINQLHRNIRNEIDGAC
jgi:L-2,4-diaminobutyrate decarboxylase